MRNWRDIVAGLLFLVLGSFFSLRAQQFSAVNGVVSDKSGASNSISWEVGADASARECGPVMEFMGAGAAPDTRTRKFPQHFLCKLA
jgi:hypothetical protein